MSVGVQQPALEVNIAWPIWAGGYPSVVEVLSFFAARREEIDALVRRAAMTVGSESDVTILEFTDAGYREISGLRPTRRGQPNSVRADVVVRAGSPLGTERIETIAVSIGSAMRDYARNTLPGAASGADAYDVRVLPTNSNDPDSLDPGVPDADGNDANSLDPSVPDADGNDANSLDPDGGPSIEDIAAATSRRLGPKTTEFMFFAGGLQRKRFDDGASDSEALTRSTTLLAAMMFDPKIHDAFKEAGFGLREFEREMSLSPDARWEPLSHPASLQADLARACFAYLERHPERTTIEPVDVALAVLDAGEQTSGLLVERFAKFPFQHDLARTRLGALIEPGPVQGSLIAFAREVAPLVEAIDGLDEAVAAIPSEGPAVDRSLLQRSVDRQFGEPTDDPARVLVGLGAIDLGLRQALDDAGVWLPLLLSIEIAEIPSESDLQPLLEAVRFEHGFRSDKEQAADQLGIAGEVNALCEVIVDRDVIPPLAVGLFGPWGSGKSFFMDMMRDRIDARTRSRPDNQKVLQIRFNAWHYADTSLWASLAVEIFERLVDPEPVEASEHAKWVQRHGDAHREQRTKLLEQLETYRTARSALDEERSKLQDERDKLEDRRARFTAEREELVKDASLTDVAGAVAADLRVQKHLQDIADTLGFRPAVEELGALATDLRDTSTSVMRVWGAARRPLLAVVLFAVFFGLLAALAVEIGLALWDDGSLAPVKAVAVGLVPVVASLAGLARAGASGTRRALALVESALDAVAHKQAEVRTTRSREEKHLDVQLAAVDEEVARTTAAIAGLDERIAATEAAANALTVGRQLYEFLVDRAAGYQKHQGIVGMLHRDFRLLDAQMRAYRDTANPDDAASGIPRYERVILYVDDLDRCPPLKVLEILQAVHLLLALPLFVVVVGVDPRWLKRSLRHAYRDLIEGDGGASDLESIPIEYLEKIFQIPLSVPDMQPDGFAKLIASLAPGVRFDPTEFGVQREPAATTSRDETDGTDDDGTGGGVAGRPDRPATTPTRAPLDVASGSAAAAPANGDADPGGTPDLLDALPVLLDSGDRAPRSIDLTADELKFAARLGVLVPTPRATKRMMNTYRLLRSTQYAAIGSRLLGGPDQPGEHQAILTLLAVSAGHPTGADRLLLELERTTECSWSDFVEKLAGLDPELDVAPLLKQALAPDQLNEIGPYRAWGPRVARFTFSL